MEVRLVQLLGSFITTTSAYSLARLEYSMKHPEVPAPPLIDRLPDASEGTLQRDWDRIERQLEAARRYVKSQEDPRGKRAVYDPTFGWLQRTTRELEQYARAVRWVMTVDEGTLSAVLTRRATVLRKLGRAPDFFPKTSG